MAHSVRKMDGDALLMTLGFLGFCSPDQAVFDLTVRWIGDDLAKTITLSNFALAVESVSENVKERASRHLVKVCRRVKEQIAAGRKAKKLTKGAQGKVFNALVEAAFRSGDSHLHAVAGEIVFRNGHLDLATRVAADQQMLMKTRLAALRVVAQFAMEDPEEMFVTVLTLSSDRREMKDRVHEAVDRLLTRMDRAIRRSK